MTLANWLFALWDPPREISVFPPERREKRGREREVFAVRDVSFGAPDHCSENERRRKKRRRSETTIVCAATQSVLHLSSRDPSTRNAGFSTTTPAALGRLHHLSLRTERSAFLPGKYVGTEEDRNHD
ncbi:hypothetical protein MRX96_012537 [Rhipicephalus microplus]